jgi:hypothetical protein
MAFPPVVHVAPAEFVRDLSSTTDGIELGEVWA